MHFIIKQVFSHLILFKKITFWIIYVLSYLVYIKHLYCVCPQTCQIGLNFASEEEARRFKSVAGDLMSRKGRKTGKYNHISACICPSLHDTAVSLCILLERHHFILLTQFSRSLFICFCHSFSPSIFFLTKAPQTVSSVCLCHVLLFDVSGSDRVGLLLISTAL